jgi:hypothetical protein
LSWVSLQTENAYPTVGNLDEVTDGTVEVPVGGRIMQCRYHNNGPRRAFLFFIKHCPGKKANKLSSKEHKDQHFTHPLITGPILAIG